MDSKKNTDKEFDYNNRFQFPLKTEKFINNDLKRIYQNYIESDPEPDLPDWPSEHELKVKLKRIKIIKKNN
jgi:hypothetical protein